MTPHSAEFTDVIVVGGGAAGLGLAHRLTETGDATVTVIEPPDGPQRPPERTWCYWGEGGLPAHQGGAGGRRVGAQRHQGVD
ncbi:FAD-dependent oxidoreductase, partial [Streptomyces rochei]|uniref:FAD-dependent oxidoreductase n=1 Tax=Streptomyces rochei TaxID=1928 RepID=UPI0033AC05D0